ncbi:MAG: hypothetical protein FWC41_07895 [Firmicutes bacterium]|nr:hypothetical protein [Bacillota bacterium]
MKSYKENNPKEDIKNLRKVLIETVQNKKDGVKCIQCGQSIWAVASAIVGWNGCFTCISGESNNSEDYEIEDVCF